MDSSQSLVETYLARALDEFDNNHLSKRLIRRLSEEVPGLFLPAAMRYLETNKESGSLRYLATLALRQDAMFEYLTSPECSSRQSAVTLFKRFLQIEPSFDVKLAERLPNRRESNLADALDSAHSTRALDILDQTSRGRRLLPILGHLPNHRDPKISAKATLFVGRRVQNPSWVKKQLVQRDQRVRANAVESLWGLNSPAAVNLLENCVDDINNRVCGNSLLGLHLLGKNDAERRVFELSCAGKCEFRSTSAWIMGRVGDSKAFKRLTELVRDDHPLVRSTALRSLFDIKRADANRPEAIAARAAKLNAEAAAQAIEKAKQSMGSESVDIPDFGFEDKAFKIRLDGSAFQVR